MTLNDIINSTTTSQGALLLLVILTLVEVAPIKINPWGALLKYIGKVTNSELNEKFDVLQDDLKQLKRDFEVKNACDLRWDILDFSNSCRNNRKHGREEWEHVIHQLKEYETYVKNHNIDNGVIEEETKYLREMYQERLAKNDFL